MWNDWWRTVYETMWNDWWRTVYETMSTWWTSVRDNVHLVETVYETMTWWRTVYETMCGTICGIVVIVTTHHLL
jgi:hypothetical protein